MKGKGDTEMGTGEPQLLKCRDIVMQRATLTQP